MAQISGALSHLGLESELIEIRRHHRQRRHEFIRDSSRVASIVSVQRVSVQDSLGEALFIWLAQSLLGAPFFAGFVPSLERFPLRALRRDIHAVIASIGRPEMVELIAINHLLFPRIF